MCILSALTRTLREERFNVDLFLVLEPTTPLLLRVDLSCKGGGRA
jgi:hypothetical protein